MSKSPTEQSLTPGGQLMVTSRVQHSLVLGGQTPITVKLPSTPAEPGAEPPPLAGHPAIAPPGITPILHANIPLDRSRVGGRSEPSRRRVPRLPTRPPLHFPEFHKPAPQEILESVTSKIDNISDDELQPVERAKLKALLSCAIHQDSLTNKINASSIGDLRVILDQLERGVDRFLHKEAGGSDSPVILW